MNTAASRIPYRQTGFFSKIVLDYIDQAGALQPFYSHSPSIKGIEEAITARKNFNTNRQELTKHLQTQYSNVVSSEATSNNIKALLSDNTFTITTAHQNNILTGPLYFIYKILHTIKLAEHLKATLPSYNFVPVYYIGSEDADLAELNHIYLAGEKIEWHTKQTGAVGRMKIDKDFLKLIEKIEGELLVLPHGKTIIEKVKAFYKEGKLLQDATFHFVNDLFGEYGLVVLLPDAAILKSQMKKIFADDLFNQTASDIVAATAEKLDAAGYKVQAYPRAINLFYLDDGLRERIENTGEGFVVNNTDLHFTKEELLNLLDKHPERFSPNVILRGIYQETILPNIAFIGGGGETAYWLQLKELFEHYKVPFPVLVLRNSFLVVEKKWQQKISHTGFTVDDYFQDIQQLVNVMVKKESANNTELNGSLSHTQEIYNTIKQQAAAIDSTLAKHVEALQTKAIYQLRELEKKMLRAEKRKFADKQRQITSVKDKLFPKNGLQERFDNLLYYYSLWGKDFIQQLYNHSLALEQEFVVLIEQ